MGLLILLGLVYLYAVAYWQYWAWVAKRERRWGRYRLCLKERNGWLRLGGWLCALAVAFKYSL